MKPRKPYPTILPNGIKLPRIAADALPRLPGYPMATDSRPPEMRATPYRLDLRTRPEPKTIWNLYPRMNDAYVAAARRIGRALPEIAFQIPQQVLRDISNAKNSDQLVAALTGFQLEPGKRSPMNAVALAGLLGPEFAGVRRLEVAERAIAEAGRVAETNAARYAARSAPALARLDPMTVPAFERAGGKVRDIGHMLGTGDLADIVPRAPRPLDPSMDVPTFARRLEAITGTSPKRNSDVGRLAQMYAARTGIRGTELPGFREVDQNAGRAMAHVYQRMESRPNDPEVRAAYRKLVEETDRQYKAIQDAGYRIEFVDKDPYDYRSNTGSDEMLADIRDNHRLRVLRTNAETSSPHPLLTDAENERFRAVHDFFGHAVQGNGFDMNGEEAAYRAHSQMFSPQAARAMATETRGQNSWFNFGPKRDVPYNSRPFPVQKAALWPREYMGDYQNFPETIIDPVVRGANGQYFPGTNHAEAADAAAAALRSTPEGRALITANKGNASNRNNDAFRTSRGRIVSREEAKHVAGAGGQMPQPLPYAQLHSSDLAPLGEQHAPLPPKLLMTSARGRDLHDALLADEAARITRKNVPQFEAAAQSLPSTDVFGAGAAAGAPKLGWYANSARALSESFGPEAPRFAALLSALSPQQPVEKNLAMALDTWEAWSAQGRPQDPKIIERIMHDVARRNPEGGQMGSRIPNSISALTSEDPSQLALSGPKVFNFHRNLIGDAQRVTLDTWMSQLANTNPSGLSRTVRGVGVPSPTYLAYSGRIRQTADALTRATGRTWTPAEVQETLWSWGKALSETAEPLSRGVHPSQLNLAGIAPGNMKELIPHLPASAITGTPDFSTLLGSDLNAQSLARQGLPAPGPTRAVSPGNLPPIDLPGLEELANNMDLSRKGLFGNRRGALGAPRDPSIIGSIESDPTGEVAATRRMTEQHPAPAPPTGGYPKRPGFMVYTRNTPREWWRLSNIEEDQLRAFRLGDYWTKTGGEFRVLPIEDIPYGNTSDLFNPIREIAPGLDRPVTPVTPLFPGTEAKNVELAKRMFSDPDLNNHLVIPAMLGGSAALSGGALTLWDFLKGNK